MEAHWINIKKELPPTDKQVLLWYNLNPPKGTPFYRCAVAQLMENKKKFLYLDGMIDANRAIGWMHIPELKLN